MNIEEEISKMAYHYCRNIKDRPEIRKNITDPEWAYYYCFYVKDRPEVYKNQNIFVYQYLLYLTF
jgi:hypothetical protein